MGTTLDELDRKIVAALQVDGRASWQQIADVVGASHSTVARRAQRLLNTGHVKVIANVDPLVGSASIPVLVQIKCQPKRIREVATAIAARSDVRAVALITGRFDILMELITPTQADLARVLVNELETIDGISSTTTETVLTHYKMSPHWTQGLLDEEAVAQLRPPGATHEANTARGLDELELSLAALLQKDGRRTYADMAKQLGINETLARRRVEAMLADGRLRSATLVRPQVLGYAVEVFVWLRVDLSQLDAIAADLVPRREVRYLAATAGFSDLVCEVILRDNADLHRFNTEVLGALPGLRGTEHGFELRTLKRGYVLVSDDIEIEPTGSDPNVAESQQCFDRAPSDGESPSDRSHR